MLGRIYCITIVQKFAQAEGQKVKENPGLLIHMYYANSKCHSRSELQKSC